ncbi:hypothetical protein NKR23_g7815 [Pleurostoma richardsiae]|uniref:Uncharacterized protein n=1 Tax=Pleurostoma richardsiae TaxID=41990 RepID=A0AA38RSL9_9PEZI|nr:hypothetical protein NKR23_g7815 [Pleurostoma richardsiae]
MLLGLLVEASRSIEAAPLFSLEIHRHDNRGIQRGPQVPSFKTPGGPIGEEPCEGRKTTRSRHSCYELQPQGHEAIEEAKEQQIRTPHLSEGRTAPKTLPASVAFSPVRELSSRQLLHVSRFDLKVFGTCHHRDFALCLLWLISEARHRMKTDGR